MQDSLIKKILLYIENLDPDNEIVKIDMKKRKISFNSLIKAPSVKYENEGFVRAYLVVKLIKELKYPIECIELEKHYNIGSAPEDKSAFLDILVRDKRKKEETFLAIECKTPEEFERKKKNIETQLFNIAAIQAQEGKVKYIVYYSLSEFDLEEQLIIIDYEKNNSYTRWSLKKDEEDLNIIPIDYGISYHAHYAKVTAEEAKEKGYKRLNVEYKKEEFWKLKDRLHNVLWGGGSSNYNDVFYYLMHIFLAKIYDELWRLDGEEYKFQIYYEDGRRELPQKTFYRIEELYRNAQANLLNQPQEILDKSTFIDLDKLSLDKTVTAIHMLEGISLTENKNESDILGDFFEAIVSTEFKQDKGQFFTHRNIVKFIIEVLDIKKEALSRLKAQNEADGLLPYIIDPSCGSGTFLLETIKEISKCYLENKTNISVSKPIRDIIQHRLFIEDKEDKNKINTWANQFIYGIEPNVELATATKVNMILHGDGNANIFIKDGLISFDEYKQPARITAQYVNRLNQQKTISLSGIDYRLNEQFDFVITNPPFSLTFGEDEDANKYKGRFLYANKKNSENLFIERWYQLLKENGKMGVVLPDSVFDTTENKYIRLFLYKYFKIRAIVSLDKIAFQPYTSTKVSVLFAQKKTTVEVQDYEEEWEVHAKEYLKLRNSVLIKLILQNEICKNTLIKMCDAYEIEFKPSHNLLCNISDISEILKNLEVLILPKEDLDEFEILERQISELSVIKEVKHFIDIKGKKVKDRDNEEKAAYKSLLSDEKVVEYLETIENYGAFAKKVNSNKEYESLKEIEDFITQRKITTIDNSEAVDLLKSFLKDYFPNGFLNYIEVIERAYEEVIEIADLDYPDWYNTKAKKHQQLFVNSWWVFGEVSKKFDNDIFYAEAEHLGYKRTKRNEQTRENELYQDQEEIAKCNILDLITAEDIWR